MNLDPTAPPLTVSGAANALNVSVDTIYDAVRRGEIQACRLGRAIRVPRAEIARLLRVDDHGSQDSEVGATFCADRAVGGQA